VYFEVLLWKMQIKRHQNQIKKGSEQRDLGQEKKSGSNGEKTIGGKYHVQKKNLGA